SQALNHLKRLQEFSQELLDGFQISFDWEPYKDAMAKKEDFFDQCFIGKSTQGNRKTHSAEVIFPSLTISLVISFVIS
ncbi:hypothetical protein V2J09_013587, partial [Rumex salicifolius]